jgi:uncharacterized membrane-anchored protein
MLGVVKLFFHEYLDDILEYLVGVFFIKLGIINVVAVFLEKYGLTFDFVYFGASGGFTWWLIVKYKEQVAKENGRPYVKVTFFRAIIYLLLSMIFAVIFTSFLQKSFLPQLLLAIVAFCTGLFWEIVYNRVKKIFSNALKDNEDIEKYSSNEDTDHPVKPGG